jgi:predicted DNA-binding transcriptional regulator AlpA
MEERTTFDFGVGSDPDQLLRVSEAAQRVQLSERSLRRAFKDVTNPLKRHKFGRSVRVAVGDLRKWQQRHVARPVVSEPVLGRISATAREILAGLGDDTAKRGERR